MGLYGQPKIHCASKYPAEIVLTTPKNSENSNTSTRYFSMNCNIINPRNQFDNDHHSVCKCSRSNIFRHWNLYNYACKVLRQCLVAPHLLRIHTCIGHHNCSKVYASYLYSKNNFSLVLPIQLDRSHCKQDILHTHLSY